MKEPVVWVTLKARRVRSAKGKLVTAGKLDPPTTALSHRKTEWTLERQEVLQNDPHYNPLRIAAYAMSAPPNGVTRRPVRSLVWPLPQKEAVAQSGGARPRGTPRGRRTAPHRWPRP